MEIHDHALAAAKERLPKSNTRPQPNPDPKPKPLLKGGIGHAYAMGSKQLALRVRKVNREEALLDDEAEERAMT